MLSEISTLWSVAYHQPCYVVLSLSACSWQFSGVHMIFTTKKSLMAFMNVWKTRTRQPSDASVHIL